MSEPNERDRELLDDIEHTLSSAPSYSASGEAERLIAAYREKIAAEARRDALEPGASLEMVKDAFARGKREGAREALERAALAIRRRRIVGEATALEYEEEVLALVPPDEAEVAVTSVFPAAADKVDDDFAASEAEGKDANDPLERAVAASSAALMKLTAQEREARLKEFECRVDRDSPQPEALKVRVLTPGDFYERAARVVEEDVDVVWHGSGYMEHEDGRATLNAAAAAIRALIPAEPVRNVSDVAPNRDEIDRLTGKRLAPEPEAKEALPPNHPFTPCEKGNEGLPGHNFTCAVLCDICGLPEAAHRAEP